METGQCFLHSSRQTTYFPSKLTRYLPHLPSGLVLTKYAVKLSTAAHNAEAVTEVKTLAVLCRAILFGFNQITARQLTRRVASHLPQEIAASRSPW